MTDQYDKNKFYGTQALPLYNSVFKVLESEHFKKQAKLLAFTQSVSEWIRHRKNFAIYKRQDMIGYAHHTLHIFRKNKKNRHKYMNRAHRRW